MTEPAVELQNHRGELLMKPWWRTLAARAADACRAEGRGSPRPVRGESGSWDQGRQEQAGTLSSFYTHTQPPCIFRGRKFPTV